MRSRLGLTLLAALVMTFPIGANARPIAAPDGAASIPDLPTMQALHAGIAPCRAEDCTALPDVERLAWWVSRGNRLAIRQSFAAARTLDAASDSARVLRQSYGAIIKQDPAAFLALARDEGAPDGVVTGDAAAVPEPILDDGAAQADELEARRAALMRVTSPALVALRDRCVAGIDARLTALALRLGLADAM